MDAQTARARYDAALVRYTEVLTRVESGDRTPGLVEQAQALYAETLRAHQELLETSRTLPETSRSISPAIPRTDGTAEPDATGATAASPAGAPAASTPGSPAGHPDPISSIPSATGQVPPVPAADAGPTSLPRRHGLQRFSPAPVDGPGERPLRRDVLSTNRASTRSEIGSDRKLAGTLPEWSPLPPGEVLAPARR